MSKIIHQTNLGIIRKPTVFDVDYLAFFAREADKNEVFLYLGVSLGESLNLTPDLYKDGFVWEVGGKMVCMYGTTLVEKDNYLIWFLATDEFDKYKYIVRKQSKRIFNELIKDKKYLFNYVHVEHTKALRWIEWLGCTICEPEPVGLDGELFCKFEVKNV